MRSTRNLVEERSAFAPAPGLMTAAQQVAHVAQTIDWFIEGAFRPEGFDTNFEEQAKVSMAYTSLAAAREWFEKAVDAAKAAVAFPLLASNQSVRDAVTNVPWET